MKLYALVANGAVIDVNLCETREGALELWELEEDHRVVLADELTLQQQWDARLIIEEGRRQQEDILLRDSLLDVRCGSPAHEALYFARGVAARRGSTAQEVLLEAAQELVDLGLNEIPHLLVASITGTLPMTRTDFLRTICPAWVDDCPEAWEILCEAAADAHSRLLHAMQEKYN
jgi:hypothetical protein